MGYPKPFSAAGAGFALESDGTVRSTKLENTTAKRKLLRIPISADIRHRCSK